MKLVDLPLTEDTKKSTYIYNTLIILLLFYSFVNNDSGASSERTTSE